MGMLQGAVLVLVALLWGGPLRAEIVVGFVTGLSGPVSSIGIPNAKGVAAAQEYVGAIAGQAVRVIQLDDTSDPTAASRNARKLVEQERVDFLIGTSGAPQTIAMAAVATEQQVPMVAISPITPPARGEGGPWVVQIPQPVPLLMRGVVDDMVARGVRTVAYIGFSDAFGDLVFDSLSRTAGAAGVRIVSDERYARADTSVTAQVLKAIAARPDAILVGGTGTPGALPAIGIRERGYGGVVYGNHGLISSDFLRVAGRAADGIICPTGPVTAAEQLRDGNPVKPVALAFRAAFGKVNGTAPTDGFSAYGFDGYLVFADAARRALATGATPGTPAFRSALRTALFSTQELVGTQGVYTFTADTPAWVDDRARIMIRIENGKWVLLADR